MAISLASRTNGPCQKVFLHFFWRCEKNVVILQPKKYNLYTLYIIYGISK